MADETYGVFTPDQCRRIWRNSLNFERLNPNVVDPVANESSPKPIYYRNDSGEVIPPYSILQVIDTVEEAGKNYLIVDKPMTWTNAVVGPFLFSRAAEVAAGGYGVAQQGPIYQVVASGSPAVNTRVGPVNAAWTVSTGSMFTVLGDDAIATGLVKVVDNHTPIIGVTTTLIPANGSGSVLKKDPSSGDWVGGTVTYTARNASTTAIASGRLVILFPVDAKWLALEIC